MVVGLGRQQQQQETLRVQRVDTAGSSSSAMISLSTVYWYLFVSMDSIGRLIGWSWSDGKRERETQLFRCVFVVLVARYTLVLLLLLLL